MSNARLLAQRVATLIGVADQGKIPAGTVFDFAGSEVNVPAGYILCDGRALSRTTYATLFAAIGTSHGAGDGSTTFNVPDARGRVVAGKDNMGGTAASRLTTGGSGVNGATLGAVGGAETHILTTAQMPAHTHANTLSDPGHSHGHNAAALTSSSTGGGAFQIVGYASATISANTTGITINNASQGSGTAHNNTQPTLVLNKIIKT